jgi:hypothetical protein
VGRYPITPKLVDPGGKLANYDTTIVNGTLTVTIGATVNEQIANLKRPTSPASR